jgi:protein required for attachment to host cells
MTVLSKDTWVLVTDSEKALFLRNETDGQDPFFVVVSKETQENPPNRDQAANRPGRFNDGPSTHRSAVQDTDWHELAKERFAADLADILYSKAHKGEFERLVIVADPSTLGSLRDELHMEVTDKIVGEVPKTLTNHPLDEIEKIVKEALKDD